MSLEDVVFLHPVEAMQLLMAKIRETKDNDAFLASFEVRR